MIKNNPFESNEADGKKVEFDQHVDKCLSMVYHYPEIVEIAEVIKKIGQKRLGIKVVSDERI